MKTFNITKNYNMSELLKVDLPENIFICFGNCVEVIKKIQGEIKNAGIIGCSASGVISSGLILEPHEIIVVYVLSLKKTEMRCIVEDFSDYEDSYLCGTRLAEKFKIKKNLSGAIILSEGLLMNSSEFTKGISDSISSEVPIMGGLAADSLMFVKTFTYDNKNIYEKSVVAIAFYGSFFKMKVFSAAGIESFGIERRVTKAIKNTIYEIDGKPALDMYQNYLGRVITGCSRGEELNFPIEISENFETKEGLIRTPLIVDVDKRTITFTSEVAEGSLIRLMMAVKSELIIAAERVFLNALEYIVENKIKDFNMFIVSCSARKISLGDDVGMEIPQEIENQFGFYS